MDLEHGSGSSKCLGIRPEITDGSGSSKHSETHPEVLDGSRSSRFVETHVEVSDDGSGSSKHSETHSNVIDRISSSKHSDVIDGSDSFKNSSNHQEDAVSEGNPHTVSKSLGSCSSSSSSDSSSEDLFQIDKNEIHKSGAQIASFPDPGKDTHRALKDESDISRNSSSISEEKDNVSPGPTPTSQVSDMPSTQSPQTQVMDRSGGYDPDRIPSSVFAISKSATPIEWSVASNESLFSIHIGNNSSSRDSIMLSPPPPVPVAVTDTENIKIGEEQSGATVAADETVKDAERVSAEAQSEKKLPPPTSRNPSSLSHHSDGSGISTRSFAFPIKRKCAWTSCYCSNSSWAFRYCTWPRYYCSNCSWAFCYCWNCSRKRLCCYSSTILPEGEKNCPQKTDGEQHQEPSAPKLFSNSTAKYWFPCLSWFPWSCNGCSCHCCF